MDWLRVKKNQVLYSRVSQKYYFVPFAQRLSEEQSFLVKGEKIDVTESVTPLVAAAIIGHLRQLARSASFDDKGRKKLLAAARSIEKSQGIVIGDEKDDD